MIKKIPIFDAQLPNQDSYWDETGILCCSLVDTPAIESNFLKFSEDVKAKQLLFSSDDEKRIIVGALMIPDKLIYRIDESGNEYYVRHSKEVISQMHERMMKNLSLYRFSLHHNGSRLESWRATPIEVWIKEYEQDKSNGIGFDLPIGTLFMSVKIDDASLWDRIKKDEFKGFSLETLMNYKLSQNQNYKKMNKHLFASLAVGETVFVQDEKGVPQKFSGQFVEDGKKVVCEDGVITAIEPENAVHVGLTQEQVGEIVAKQVAEMYAKLEQKLDGVKENFENQIKELNILEPINEIKLALQQHSEAEKQPEVTKVEIEEVSAESMIAARESFNKALDKYKKQ